MIKHVKGFFGLGFGLEHSRQTNGFGERRYLLHVKLFLGPIVCSWDFVREEQ